MATTSWPSLKSRDMAHCIDEEKVACCISEENDDFFSKLSLKSCDMACCIGEENDDLFRKLPEEIWVSIISSSFTMNEAAKFSLVSRQCEIIWRYFPVLIFEDCKAKEKNWDSWDAIFEDRACFVRRVDRTLEKHLGTTIDELRITYDLERCSQSYVDKWVAIALDKQVKRLELNFSSIFRGMQLKEHRSDGEPVYSQPLDLPPKLTGFMSCLTSLCLKHVNVTDEFIDYLPHSCPLLEMLCIQGSKCLTRVTGTLSAVKQLEVYYCCKLQKIDVSAQKLQSFTLFSVFRVAVHIVDAPSLFKMSIGWAERILPCAFNYLSTILSQLVYLKISLDLCLPLMMHDLGSNPICIRIALVTLFTPEKESTESRLVNGVAMPKLEHLEFQVSNAMVYSSLYGFISVITASPNLQKLTLKLEKFDSNEKCIRELQNWADCGSVLPIKCLKTLEVVGYRGKAVDLELAFFVLENASMLEEVIVDFIPLNDNDKRERLAMLQMKLPQGVKLTMK